MRTLDHAATQRALHYLYTSARPLEAALARVFFAGGARAEAVALLGAYQNDDGGFGHALEPDVRAPESSALATSIALKRLTELEVTATAPIVARTLNYLQATLDATTRTWDIIPPAAQDAPHAPWWQGTPAEVRANFGDCLVNPRAEIVAWLWYYAAALPGGWLADLTAATVAAIVAGPLDMHALICAAELLDAPGLPESDRAAILSPVRDTALAIAGTTAEDWQGYGPQPLGFVATPDAALADTLAATIPANLDFLISQQSPTGAWEPTWSWGDEHDPDWQAARRDWSGVMTLRQLRTLRAFGRLAE